MIPTPSTRLKPKAYLLILGISVLLAVALFAYGHSERAQGVSQTSTASAYALNVQALNSSRAMAAGTTATFLFNVTSSGVGALYFYASNIPLPGEHWTMTIQNVTTGNIKLPQGVHVSYPSGQAVFGTSRSILDLRISLSPSVNGTVGLEVGGFQQVSPSQVVGSGVGFYLTVGSA